jgi:hypothetical protein
MKSLIDKMEELLTDSLIPNAQTLIDKIKEVDKAAYDVVKTFGLSNSQVMAIKSSLTGAASEVERLGGMFSDVLSIQTQLGKITNRNAILMSESFAGIYAASEVSGQTVKEMGKSFKDTGFSLYSISEQMEGVVNTARSIGVNAVAVSSQVIDNMGELNRYNFEGGVQGLAKMAANATNLRIDMKTTMGFAENVFDPENAIKMAASMQRLGVNVSGLKDPLELMYNAMNNPEKLQDQLAELGKSFTKMNADGNFEIMPGAKRRLRELNLELKLPAGTLEQMGLASAELDKKMSQIRMPSGLNLSKEQQTMIANMSEMKDGVATIKFTDENGEAQTKNVMELKEGDLAAIAETGRPKSIEEIQKGQLNLQERINASLTVIKNKVATGVAGAKTTDDTYKVAAKIETAIYDFISDGLGATSKISSVLDNTSDVLIDSIVNLVSGEKSLSDVFTNIGSVGNELATQLDGNLKTALDNAETNLNEFAGGNNKIMTLLEELMGKMMMVGNNSQTPITPVAPITPVEDFIKMPGMTIEPLAKDTIFGGTGFESFIDGLKEMKTLPNNTNVGNNQFEEFLKKFKDVKPNNGSNEPQTPIEIKSTAEINLNIKIDAPNQIDTNQIILALENQGVKQKLYQSMKEAMYNNGLSSPTSSKTKLMNPYLNR